MRKLTPITFTVLLCTLGIASVARAQQHDNEPNPADAREIYNYSLSMDKIHKAAAATRSLQELGKKHPELNQSQDSSTIDGTVENINKYPEAVAAVRSNGLSPREYVVCFMTLIQTTIAVGMKKSGTFKDYPPKLLAQVNRANLDFTEQHWDEIQQITNGLNSDQ